MTIARDMTDQLATEPRGSVLEFPEGLPGFDQARRWQLVQNEDARPFLWLQSVETPQLTLLIVEPRFVVPDYQVLFSRHELARVGLAPADPKVVFAVVTLRADGPTVNLRAPIVIHPDRMLGTQIILEDSQWPLRHPILPGQA